MWIIVTTMDDVRDPAVNVYGPFKTKPEAMAWAKSNRENMITDDDDPDVRDSFENGPNAIHFGSFKWAAMKMIKPIPHNKKSKRRK